MAWRRQGKERLQIAMGGFSNGVVAFDGYILARVEKLSHSIQLLTGYDCFSQTSAMYFVAAGCYVAHMVQLILKGGLGIWMVLFFVPVVLWYLRMAIWGMPLDDFYRANRFVNHRKADREFVWIRVGMLLSSSVVLIAILLAGIVIFAVVALLPLTIAAWLSACNPLPPGKGKVRDWIRTLFSKPAVAVVEAG